MMKKNKILLILGCACLGAGSIAISASPNSETRAATDTVVTFQQSDVGSFYESSNTSTTVHSFTVSSVDFGITGSKTKASGTGTDYGYIMMMGGQIYNTSTLSNKYIKSVAVTYTSGTGTSGSVLTRFSSVATTARVTSGGTAPTKSGTYTVSNGDTSLAFFNICNTNTSNTQISKVTVTFSDASVSTTLSLSSSSLSINLGGTGTSTITPNGFTADHYTAVSSDSTVASATLSGNIITVSGVKAGNATITISGFASADGTAVATIELPVTVNTQTLKASPATTEIKSGNGTKSVTLTASYFNGTVTYSATSSDEAVATVAIANSSVGAAVISAHAVGTATITYTATDGVDTLTAITAVTVASPYVTLSTNALPISPDGSSQTVSATAKSFAGTVTFSIDNSNTAAATATISGNTVTITPVAVGSATITVTATDGTDTATATIAVTVVNMTIADLRGIDGAINSTYDGKIVTVTGTVTKIIPGTGIYIQDGTHAVYVFDTSVTASSAVLGNKAKVEGKLSEYNGLLEISNPTITALAEAGEAIGPKQITAVSQLTKEFAGAIIEVTFKLSSAATVTSGTASSIAGICTGDLGDLTLRCEKAISAADATAINTIFSTAGTTQGITFVGPLGYYNAPQLSMTAASDICLNYADLAVVVGDLHMSENVAGQCNTLYATANDDYSLLSSDQQAMFNKNIAFILAHQRLLAWTIAKGGNTSGMTLGSPNSVGGDSSNIILYSLSVLGAISAGAFFLLRKKKQA